MPASRLPLQTPSDRVVAVGLLTQRDIDVLGAGFDRLFPVESTADFDDLLKQLDALEWPSARPKPGG